MNSMVVFGRNPASLSHRRAAIVILSGAMSLTSFLRASEPVISVHDAITRTVVPHATRVITVTDLDTGSTGGEFEGEPLGIETQRVVWLSGDYPDALPDDPVVGITNAGVYSVGLEVVNTLGNAATGTTAVTVILSPVTGQRYVNVSNPTPSDPEAVLFTPDAWWKADGNALDAASNFDGTWSGTEAYAAGVFGQAFNFDGASSLQVSSSAILPAQGDFTFACWVNIPANPAGGVHGAFFMQHGSGTGMFYAYTTYGTANNGMRWNGVGTTEVLVGSDIRGTGWRHVALVRNGNDYTLYLDGAVDATGSNSGSINADGPFILSPAGASGADRRLDGRLDDVLIFQRALSLPEVQTLADDSEPFVPDQPHFSTWETAANVIQDAIDVSLSGETIVVWQGVYDTGGKPHEADGFSSRVHLTAGRTLRAESEDPEDTVIEGQRDPEVSDNPFDRRSATANDGWGTNSVRGVYMEANSTLIGFTVQHGATTTNTTSNMCDGSGILAVNNTAVISNCVLRANTAARYGGGGYRGTYYDCRIEDNYGHRGGGGVSDGVVHRCHVLRNHTAQQHGTSSGSGGGLRSSTAYDSLIADNSVGSWGGGMQSGSAFNTVISNNTAWGGGGSQTTPLTGCILADNTARYGGGMMGGTATDTTFLRNRATGQIGGGGAFQATTLTRCIFIENSTTLDNGGGGVLGRYPTTSNWSVDTVVKNSIFIGNQVTHETGGTGGGAAGVRMYNCLLFDNEASVRGGGAYDSILYNCTVVGNTAGGAGGGVYGSDSSDWQGPLYAAVTNSIVIDNTSGSGGANYDGLTLFGYSLSDPVPAGTLNLTGDPNFVNPAATNFQLQVKSVLAINRGLELAWMTDEGDPASKDLDGNARMVDRIVDLGAYEYPEPLRQSLIIIR